MAQEITASNYKDRTTGLVLFGVLEILMGVVAGFIGISVLLVSLFVKLPNAPSTPWAGSLFYLFIAVALVWLGVGSLQARRWARALLLVLSCIWLVVGFVAGVTMAFTLPMVLDNLGDTAQSAGEAQFVKMFALLAVGGMVLVIYILIPGALALFYRSPHVRMTCEVKDPEPRWTDHCPLPVLALSLIYGFGFLFLCLFEPFFHFVFPFFGTLVSGLPGALAVAVSLAVLGYLVWGCYQSQVSAWWAAVVFSVLGYGSALVTFTKVSLLDLYIVAGIPPEQLVNIEKTGLLKSNFMVIQTGLSLVLSLGYLLLVKRYFKAGKK